MKSTSIGTQAESPSKRIESGDRRAGFTLIEALVALALVLAFAAALGPLMFQSQRILVRGDGQVRAELLLRSLLETPFNRTDPQLGRRDGESGGLRWSLDVDSATADDDDAPKLELKKGEINWGLFRVTAHVSWGAGQTVTAQTLHLGQVN